MNNVVIGSEEVVYYETIGGGQGACPDADGPSGVHVAMSNTLNTPIEALELEFPLRIVQYGLRTGSGGAGLHRGGDGVVREFEALAPLRYSLLTERRRHPPPGADGGEPGATGRNLLDGEELPPKAAGGLQPGQRLRIETPGGGGWGIALGGDPLGEKSPWGREIALGAILPGDRPERPAVRPRSGRLTMHGGGAGLIACEHDEGVDVDVARARDCEHDAIRHIFGRQRRQALVDRVGSALVTSEPYEAELGLDHAGIDLGHTDRSPEELEAQHFRHRPHGELRCVVAATTDIGLIARDRSDHHHDAVAARFERRQERSGHTQRADHVRLVHRAPIVVVGVLDAIAADGTAGGVDENAALRHLGTEMFYRLRVRDIEADGACPELLSESTEAVFAASTNHDVEALGRQPARSCHADSAARSRDHCRA